MENILKIVDEYVAFDECAWKAIAMSKIEDFKWHYDQEDYFNYIMSFGTFYVFIRNHIIRDERLLKCLKYAV